MGECEERRGRSTRYGGWSERNCRASAMDDRYTFVLATDLDGTFLGGSPEQRAELYADLQERRDRILLIFATGRSLRGVRKACREPGIPQPDYAIADVGTTAFVRTDADLDTDLDFEPLSALQEWIASRWADGGDRVRALLADEPGIQPQRDRPQYRVSYDYQPSLFQPQTLQKIEAAGFDWILSADKYLDVMPRGVAKGPVLLKLLEILDIDREKVLVAGDTLNDLSLFQTGLKGVAVGNAEPKLVEALAALPGVYRSPHPGAAGIRDAIERYGFFRPPRFP